MTEYEHEKRLAKKNKTMPKLYRYCIFYWECFEVFEHKCSNGTFYDVYYNINEEKSEFIGDAVNMKEAFFLLQMALEWNQWIEKHHYISFKAWKGEKKYRNYSEKEKTA
jgi:hypothetical protein